MELKNYNFQKSIFSCSLDWQVVMQNSRYNNSRIQSSTKPFNIENLKESETEYVIRASFPENLF